MTWKKASPELAAMLAGRLEGAGCQRKTMFGCPVFKLHDRMVAGVWGDSVFIHLSPNDCAAIRSASDEIVPFEPIAGRPMREYVVIPDSMCDGDDFFLHWLDRAIEYAASLPPKAVKTGRGKTPSP